MKTLNCTINGNEIITNGVCNENVVLMFKKGSDGATSRKVVGQAALQASIKTYPVERNLGETERTFRKGETVPAYILNSIL